MADKPHGYWLCSCNDIILSRNLLICPKCETRQPNYHPDQWPGLDDGQSGQVNDGKDHLRQAEHFTQQGDPGQRLSQPPGNLQRHRAEVQQRTEQQMEARRMPNKCHECGFVLQIIGKFCPECGTKLSATQNAPPTNTAQVPIQAHQFPECYFCARPLQLTGDKQCLHCRKPQPNPQGPPCVHGCGVKLISSTVKVCARCGKSQQLRAPARPTDSITSPRSPPVKSEYDIGHGSGYGYPNDPAQSGPQYTQQFGLNAPIHTAIPIRQPPPPGLPHPNSGHAQSGKDGMSGPANSPSTAGTGGNFPSGSRETNLPVPGKHESSGHPHSARSTKVEGFSEENKSGGDENQLKNPIQETSQDPHLQYTESHPLQPDENANNRKRKKPNESSDAGNKSKQNKLDKNDNLNADGTKSRDNSGDSSQTSKSTNNNSATTATASTSNITTTTVSGATITTTTTAAPSTTTTATASTSSSNKDQQVKRRRQWRQKRKSKRHKPEAQHNKPIVVYSSSSSDEDWDGSFIEEAEDKNEQVAYMKSSEAPHLFQPQSKNKGSSRDRVSMDGLAAPTERSVRLTFHVLIPKTFWEWDSNSHVRIRFGHLKLGEWSDYGDFQEVSDFGDGIFEMTCTFKNFDVEILKHPLPYKYVVHSPKAKKSEDCYECLHAHTSHWHKEFNRCLFIPPQKRPAPGGEYHKIDNIAYPKNTNLSKSFLKNMKEHAIGILSTLSGGLFGGKDKDNKDEIPESFKPLNHQEMSIYSLECYLSRYKDMLCNGSFSGFDIHTIALDISFIYNSLCAEHVSSIGDPINRVQAQEKKVDRLAIKGKLRSWFESIILSLAEKHDMDPARRLISATCITHCINMPSVGVLYMSHDAEKFLLPLAGLLSLHPDVDVKAEYDQLCSKIPVQQRSVVAEAISELCSRLSGRSVKSFAIEWLLALPLYHFLTKRAELYGTSKMDFEVEWGFYNAKFGITTMCDKAKEEKQFVLTYYERVKDYFQLDPLLLKLFARLTPKVEFQALCERVPPYLSAEVLVRRALQPVNVEDESWKNDIERVKFACSYGLAHYSMPRYLSAMVKSSCRLCTKLANKLRSSEENAVKLLGAAFSCAICAIENAHSLYKDEQGKAEKLNVLDGLRTTLRGWITRGEVIGGSVFGNSVPSYLTRARPNWKGRQELKVWQSLLSVDIPPEYQSLIDWHHLVEDIMKQRIYEVTSEKPKIDLVIEMEKMEKVHPVLEGIIMDAALKAVDGLLANRGKYQAQVDINIEGLAKQQSERVGKLLGKIFDKQYPDLDQEPTLKELFGWNHWPRFISICECQPKLKQGLSENCVGACSFAKNTVLALCGRAQTAQVSINELKMIGKNDEQMIQLFDACSTVDQDKKLGALTALQSVIKDRKAEYTMFIQYQTVLKYLFRYLDPKIADIAKLDDELRRDYGEANLNDLCRRDPETKQPQLVCFKSAGTLSDFAEGFYVLSKRHGSELFSTTWKGAMSVAIKDNPDLVLDNVYPSVWQPCLDRCKQLLFSLSDLSMKLVDVDKVFKDHKDNIDTQLLALFKGVSDCTREQFDWRLIERAIVRIRQYWELCRYRKGANIFLRIRDSLGLKGGDFSLVEKLSKELATSGGNQTLNDVDDSLWRAGVFLEDIASNPEKVDCLDTFARCKDIVKWLKRETKDVNEIQHFVNVALATAAGGEGDLSHDKLSDLRTVGSGFASLIYNFPNDAGFIELKEACTYVWDALEKNSNLPHLLDNCNKDIEWYQSVKETQGSVEVTSYGQMRNILKYGRYQIGTTIQSKAVHTIHDLISLKLCVKDKKLSKTSYNLDDLRDLESKLVLITGSKAENRTEVDHYLNILQHVTRIAEVLLALRQAGNVAYSGRVVMIDCSTYMAGKSGQGQELQLQEEMAKQHVAELNTRAKEMENALIEWEDEVKKSRSRYYELNYYTTRQLLRLRKELGLSRHNPHRQIDPEVLALLQSISQDVTSESVYSVLTNLEKVKVDLQAVASLVPHEAYEDEVETQLSDSEMPPLEPEEPGPSDAHPVENLPESPTLTVLPSSGTVKPQLTEQELNDVQKQILTDMVEYQDYSRLLVLKAFEECDEMANAYDIEVWCGENENLKFDGDDEDKGETEAEDTADSSDESSSESASSDVEENDLSVSLQHSPIASSPVVKRKSSPAAVSPKVKVVHRQIINESHPAVQELIEDEYDLEAAIEAVRLCGGSLQKAMDYLARKDTEDGEDIVAEFEPILDDGEAPNEGENIVFYDDLEVEEKFLSLDELGTVLKRLSEQLPEWVREERKLPEGLKDSSPNLIVTHPSEVLRTVLTLYMENENLPLPTLEEVLICNSTTTVEEINLLWQRAVGDPGYKRIFCLVHAEKLSYQTCDKVVETLKLLAQGRQGYRLVVVCSKEGEDKSHIVSKLVLHKRTIILKNNNKCQSYLRCHFIQVAAATQANTWSASIVDHENSCVRVVSSRRNGMGKSLFIQRMANRLGIVANSPAKSIPAVIPIHGPLVTADVVLNFLKEHYKDEKCKIYHFDVAPSILYAVDTILFSLLILRGLMDSQGRVWRCHSGQLYAVEVTMKKDAEDKTLPEARTLDLLNLLPTVECLSPVKSMDTKSLGPSLVGMDDDEFRGATFQRVYQYLRRHISNINLDRFRYQGNPEGSPVECLKLFLQNCGVQDPAWSEIHHFAKFLNLQLEACEKSVFCDETLVGDIMSGLKGFVVKFMISMSRDFATPSLRGEVARDTQQGQLVQYEIEQRRRWEESSHPYIFFNNDGVTITFVGFIITKNGDMTFPRPEPRIMTPQLYTGLICQGVNFSEDYRRWDKGIMIQKLSLVMGIEYPYDPDDTYVLTVDNLIKILAIQMRFRCGIPVVIMGETGCGKTRLIRYMCDLAREGREARNMLILKIHGGTKESDIIDFIDVAEKEAKKNKANKMDTVVFFDEANTTDAIGLIKEIMCDRRLHGRPVSQDLKFIAACNPYRRHSEDMIKRLETAGLGFYVRATETQQKLGKIPLRQLVYRVLDLPPSMRPLVYDFGQLQQVTEDDYIRQIVHDHVKKHEGLKRENAAIVPVITGVLATSQAYMRGKKDECSFVSLRDVERAMIVFEHFYEHIDDFQKADQKQAMPRQLDEDVPEHQHPSNITTALILAVSVCYHARLQKRAEYEDKVSAKFVAPLALPGGAAQFRNEITWCQNVLLDNMELGQNIAKNAALRENVFMMAICVELRIPLFLVGKPGSSKSLAKSIIQDSMHGKTSRSDLLKKFKQVHMFSYQCSQLATPESVIEVFKSAKKFQSTQDTSQYVSVVVLDEVGLAEDSPNLPLKALHPLLEDGTEGAGAEGRDEVIDRGVRVAFIGISNWALDPAKMNRGVMVTRGTPDIKELKFSAKGICGKEDDDKTREKLEPYFKDLAEAYEAICQRQEKEFFGLRDFYSLIKMLYWMCKKSRGIPLTWPQMKHAIMRNFGGSKSDDWDPFKEFEKRLNLPTEELNREDFDEKTWQHINPDCSRIGLIKTSLDTKETSFHGENRYLLFLTENYAALDILEHYIRGKKHERVAALEPEDTVATTHTSKPFTLFGSSFPKDKEYTQVCRNINQIKICMETGRTVILLNLENLYESLYDVLNQYYMHYGDNRYVDLGLQTHRVKCRVHKDFKLILIAERETVYEKFPTPLINRLEKHFVLTSSVLKDWQQNVLVHFENWIRDFSGVRGVGRNGGFKEGHAFIGYQKDTPAAVVFQASRQLKRLRKGPYWRLESLQECSVFRDISLEELATEEKGSELWKLAVLNLSQYLLLQIASDDALIRLKRTSLADQQKEFMQLYFSEQHHDSIIDFVRHHIENDDGTYEGLLMQVTTHGHLLQREELERVAESVHMRVEAFLLQEFDTELDFSNKVGPLFQRQDEFDTTNCLIVIQCDSGHMNGDLIACARYRIYDERVKALDKNKIQHRVGVTHVLFIINLPHQVSSSSFVGFQGDPWISYHIDDLRPTSGNTIEPLQAISATISELFIGGYINDIVPLLDTVHEQPQQQISVVESEEGFHETESRMMYSSPTPERQLEGEESEKESDKESDIHSLSDKDDRDELENEDDSEDQISAMESLPPQDSEHVKDKPILFTQQEPTLEGAESAKIPGEMEVVDIEDQTPDMEFATAGRLEDDEILDSAEQLPYAQGAELGDLTTQVPPAVDMRSDNEENFHQYGEGDSDFPPTQIPPMEQIITDKLSASVGPEEDTAMDLSLSEVPKPKLVTVDQCPIAQCQRLYGCIQAAASRLEDATKDRSTQRVSRLTKLIPRDPVEHIEPNCFYGILVMHLYKLLKEREEDRPDLSEWVLSEALNASKLEVGGTFRNVLARKIDEVVIPIFAKIIACIDCNYNLDLIDPKAQDSPHSQFWLAMFGEPKVLQLKYSEMVQGDTVPGVGGRKSNQDFKCQMPFFWLIRDAVDSQWDSAKSRAGSSRKTHHAQLCEFILATPVGAVLESVDTEHCEDFYEYYLHDFVRSVHRCKHRKTEHDNMEYQLVSDALNHMVLCSDFQHHSLISRIAALHIVHWTSKSHILWFGQLVSHSPSIMESLLGVLPPKDFPEMELHLNAALKVMELREPPLQKDNPNPNLTQWLNHIRLSRNAIDSILGLKSSSELVLKARHCWQRLHATQLFVEHVIQKHPTVDIKVPARRLTRLWKQNSDFLKRDTMKSVQLQLNSMEKKLKDEHVNKDKIKLVKKSGREFFMELVSELCFGGRAAPEPDLVKMLLDNVFVEKSDSTQELTPYKDDKADKIPTIRSFLLQLLLEHSMDQVRDHLKDYLDRSCRVVSGKRATIDQNLYLLIIQCLEDSLAKKFSYQCLAEKAHEATAILLEGFYDLQEHRRGTPTLEYLEGVAMVRFSLSVVAEVLKNEEIGQHFMELLRAAGRLCSDREVNCIDPTGRKDTVGPVIYLLKLIVRQYGMPCLKAAAEIHEWLIPAQLKSEEDKLVDPFIVYGGTYKKLRESMSGAMYGNQIEELGEATQNLQPQEVVYLLLALYEKATLSRASTNPAKRISGEATEKLDEFIVNYGLFSNELRFTARALLANQQGGRILEQMSVSPRQPLQCRTILGVVVHAAAVLFNRQKVDILLPFVNILNNPAALNHSYLPTMPEDQLMLTQVAMASKDPTGKFYECPRGHKYFVGNCGRVASIGVCNVCRAPIGGVSYNLQQGNKLANLHDTTKMGHDLGAPQNCIYVTPERDLSARAVCILRALMHSAFIWASCNNDQALGAIAGLVNAQVPPQQLPEFFWAHLEKDLELLGKDTKKGLEENVMILHLVLRQILTLNPPTDGTIQAVNTLGRKEDRKTWERIFNQHYIQPVLTNLDKNLATTMDLVANDDQQDHDQLFFLVYEKVKYTEESLEPHLWTYRSRITLEHLRQSLHDKKLKETYPILHEFLQAEADLRATQYLPDLARLQQCLYDKFNRQLDKKDSKQQTVGLFIEELPNETTKNEYREMIGGLKAAWALVGHKLKNHGRLPLEEKFYIPAIDDETKMEYLVPTTSEAGVCTTALVDFLTLTHNNFIERCRGLVAGKDQSILSFWREHKVPITHLHRCHLLDYEHQLPSIILSHCHYSLKVGKGQDVKYDHQALEKHILNRFIHGKPLILLDIPQVVYRKDIYTTGTFAEVRKKVAPQEMLPQRVRQGIVAELRTPDRLREALDVVEIVLGFLSSGGGKADKPLLEYIDKTLKMKKRRFSQKAKMVCELKHALSLWETIAVELARQLCLRGQEPFDSIRQEFLRDLSKDENGEDQFAALDRCLGQFDPDLLLGTLYEFIETYVKHSPQQERDESLAETLELFLEQYGTELPQLAEFPASIKLDQAVAAWKHTVQYYAKRH